MVHSQGYFPSKTACPYLLALRSYGAPRFLRYPSQPSPEPAHGHDACPDAELIAASSHTRRDRLFLFRPIKVVAAGPSEASAVMLSIDWSWPLIISRRNETVCHPMRAAPCMCTHDVSMLRHELPRMRTPCAAHLECERPFHGTHTAILAHTA